MRSTGPGSLPNTVVDGATRDVTFLHGQASSLCATLPIRAVVQDGAAG